MATDNWVITDSTKELITVNFFVDGISYETRLGISNLDISNQQDILNAIRDRVTEQRNSIIAEQQPPLVIEGLIGHSENF